MMMIKSRNSVQDVESGLQEAAAILNIVNIPLETYEDIAMEFELDSMRRQSQENLVRLSTSGSEPHVTTPIGISTRASSGVSQRDSRETSIWGSSRQPQTTPGHQALTEEEKN